MTLMLTLTMIELKKLFKDRMQLVRVILFIGGVVVLNSFLFNTEYSFLLGGEGVISVLFSGFIFALIVLYSFSNISRRLAKNYDVNFLTRIRFLSINKSQYIFSLLLSSYIMTLLMSFLMFFILYLVYRLYIPSFVAIGQVIIAIGVISFALGGLGIIIACIFPYKYWSKFFSFLFSFIFIFGTGSVFPKSILPYEFQRIIMEFPFSKMVYVLEDLWRQNKLDMFYNTLFTIIFAIVFCTLAFILFRWDKYIKE